MRHRLSEGRNRLLRKPRYQGRARHDGQWLLLQIFSLFPSTCTDTFGPKFATVNLSLLYTAKGTSAFLVPVANLLKTWTGSWQWCSDDCHDELYRGGAGSLLTETASA
jgi:hypothetical protein